MNKIFKIDPRKLMWQLATFVALAILFASPITRSIEMVVERSGMQMPSAVGSADASEIYQMFTCPCCGAVLNKEEQCCGSMTEMIEFIDKVSIEGLSRDEVVLAVAKIFGMERVVDDSTRESIREMLMAKAPLKSGKISVKQTSKDLGRVRLGDGVASTEFTIVNVGEDELIVDKLASSCGCTSGSVIYEEVEGPRFFMPGHGQDEPEEEWQVAIKPGDEAVVRVYYDPAIHPELTGAVTRTVSVFTNDPVEFETKLTIKLEQVR